MLNKVNPYLETQIIFQYHTNPDNDPIFPIFKQLCPITKSTQKQLPNINKFTVQQFKMQFISALSVSKLENAFELISIPNNQKIKQGEALLQQLRNEEGFILMICTYLMSNQTLNNKLKAALQLQSFIQDDIIDLKSDRFSLLLRLYMHCEDKIAKILIKIFKYRLCTNDTIPSLISSPCENQTQRIRVMKVLQVFVKYGGLDDQFDQVQQFQKELLKYLGEQMKYALNTQTSYLLKYRILSVFQDICDNYMIDPLQKYEFDYWLEAVINIIQSPDPAQDEKYLIKLKICAMRCLLFLLSDSIGNQENINKLCLYSGQICTKYITKPQYTQYCLTYLNSLAYHNIYSILFPDHTTFVTAIRRVFVMSLEYIYNESVISNKLQTDPQDYITCYILNHDYDPIRSEAVKTIRTLTSRHIEIWKDIVKDGINSPPINNRLISFIVDSYLPTFNPEIKNSIQTVAMEVYTTSIHSHFFSLYEKIMNNSEIGKSDIFQFLCEIRLVNNFLKKFTPEILKVVCLLCSKMALKFDLVSSCCYNFINYVFRQTKKNIKFEPSEFADLYNQILMDMINNQENLTNYDIYLIQSGIFIIAKSKPQFISLLKEPLKKIILILIYKLQTNKQYESMDVTFCLMDHYMAQIGYEPEFEGVINYCMSQRLFTDFLIKCYLKYLTTYSPDTKTAQSLFIQMSNSKFWLQNKSDFKMNANLYIFLVKLLPKGSQYYSQIIPNFITIIQEILSDLNSPSDLKVGKLNFSKFPQNSQNFGIIFSIIEPFFCQLIELIVQCKAENQFYNIILKLDPNRLMDKKQDILIKMINTCPPTNSETLQKVVTIILLSKRFKISEKNVSGYFKLVFDLSPQYLRMQGKDGKKPITLWSNVVKQMVEYISNLRSEVLRVQFCSRLLGLAQNKIIEIQGLLAQKFQLRLQGLLNNSFN